MVASALARCQYASTNPERWKSVASTRYREIADSLRKRIQEGEWKPGETLPRHADLAREYGASRNAVARAISVLEDEGRLWAVPRRGTIVRPDKRRVILRTNVVRRNSRHVIDGKPVVGGYTFPAAQGDELWIHHIELTISFSAFYMNITIAFYSNCDIDDFTSFFINNQFV